MSEEIKAEEKSIKEDKKARIVFICFFALVAALVVGILVYGHIREKNREERAMKALSGVPSAMQDAVDDFGKNADQIIEDMKNDPNLK